MVLIRRVAIKLEMYISIQQNKIIYTCYSAINYYLYDLKIFQL
jgi:hypothetical protein